MSATDIFFFQQGRSRTIPKRFRKTPEELPDSLKYAHLNPKVAAFLASKDRQKQEEQDLFGDGLGKKSLMPELSQAFITVKSRLDSSLSNDEDSQRYLFEEARASSGTVLMQLAKIIYYYDDLYTLIPKSLEYQLLCGTRELTSGVVVVPREWQTQAMKEMQAKLMASAGDVHSDDDGDAGAADDGRHSRALSMASTVDGGFGRNKRRVLSKGGHGLPEIVEDRANLTSEAGRVGVPRMLTESRLSISSRTTQSRRERGRSLQIDKPSVAGSIAGRSPGLRRGLHDFELMSALTETASDNRSTAMANSSYYMSVIQFQLSNKSFEEKGWVVQKGREDKLAKESILEWCVQILQQAKKLINEQKVQEKEMGYTHPVQERYYGDTKKETMLKYRKSPIKTLVNPATRGDKPKIPSMYNDRNEGKQLMLTCHLDGTTVTYYPSGRPAVVVVAAGFGHPGYYTIAYDDDSEMKMLVCFTPSGHGVLYHSNGNVRFMANKKGGHIAESSGRIEKRWKWPPGGVKLIVPISFQINSCLGFRCVSESQMTLFFNCQKETTRFSLSATPGATPPKIGEENEQLLTNCTFSSKSAKDLLRIFAPKTKSHKGKSRKKEKLNRHLAELVKSVDIQDKSLYDTEADKELARLQRKSKNLIDDWMEHYRIAIGLRLPQLNNMPDTPTHICRHSRKIQSAKSWDGSKAERRGDLGIDQRDTMKNIIRAPSAPSISPKYRRGSARSPVHIAATPTVKFDKSADGLEPTAAEENAVGEESQLLNASIVSFAKFTKTSSVRSKSATQMPKLLLRQDTSASLPDREMLPSLLLCPGALRQIILNQQRPQCRCNRHIIPNIGDVEFDRYITKEAPPGQLQIIMVHSSIYPNSNPAENMMNRIHSAQNRNRTRPCLQTRFDMFRIFKYDINTATEDCNHTQPLLLTRHNVVPGMFLIYASGQLLFCDHIMNGYGYTQRDFKKQIMKSRHDMFHGKTLPNDFRFSPSKGCQGPRAAWGGEIGGTGVDKFGSPGTVHRSLTEIPAAEKSALLSKRQTEHVSDVFVSLKSLLDLKALDSSDVPPLPPITLQPFQRYGFSHKSFKRQPVRLQLSTPQSLGNAS